MARVCVVDDQEMLRDSLKVTLEREDHRVETFEDGVQALEALRQDTFEAVITDLKMPKLDGVALLRKIREAGLNLPVIMMTAHGTVSSAVEAMKLGAFDYIQKPFDADEIVILVERALMQRRLLAENEALRTSIRDMQDARHLVGDGPSMRELHQDITRIARSNSTVLITGESGTGKELVARRIHAESDRASRPLLCLNCAALSSTLLESELFGHEKGAFTGADRVRKGRFELADGGTLMLDEISEMALSLQAKLLRVLQEHEYERVGSSVTRTCNARVIATTNRNLADWVAKARFREDLYFRLNVLPIAVPALQDRKEDIEMLTAYFLERASRREGRDVMRFEPAAMRMLKQYSWPGNVRELENICDRAAVLISGDVIIANTLVGWLNCNTRPPELSAMLRPGHMLEDMERQLIERTLVQFNGHREKTARMLGMGVRTLGMKLKNWREEARKAG